ncbi:MAG: GGDEF domain-containing protein [Clostridium sp.]|uniref:GGDEF domain-containing protein n=1 Tax=Clostridium sp. TaxID=1506 RepID=UPI0029072A1B|nr:GGDEF domain-containing protein [Clostridium sp.]MDU7337744.1 GGDEF domain-containing protein [Clostridium sp.]
MKFRKSPPNIVKLRFEEELEYQVWGNHLLWLTWVLVAMVSAVELAVFLLKQWIGGIENAEEYLVMYVVIPSTVNAIVLLVTHIISHGLLAKGKYSLQAYLFLFNLSLLCLNVAIAHSDVPVVYVIFCFPILLSLIYIDDKLLLGIFCLNTCLFSIYIAILYYAEPFYQSNYKPDVTYIITSIFIIFACYLTARMSLRRQNSLVYSIICAHERTKLDSLTGLYNHATFYDTLSARIQEYHLSPQPFSLIIMDIDDFKKVNDQNGHDAGDEIILELVKCINNNLGENEIAYRYGGEEFTIITDRVPEGDVALAESIRLCFEEAARKIGNNTNATVSVGIARYNAERFGAQREFFAAADEALYSAKRSGKNHSLVWHEGISSFQL